MIVRRHNYLGFSFATLIVSSCATQDVTEHKNRWALLIANERYTLGKPLKNPVADAQEVAKALQKTGFTTLTYKNLPSKTEMEEAMKDFFKHVGDDDIVWVYYAGHGIQENGKNYLLPTQTNPSQTLSDQAFPAQAIMNNMSKRKGMNIIVLDTCRTPGENSTHDLVEVGGNDVLIMFSTASGKKSPEGQPGKGSPLSKYLVAGINQYPWSPLEDLFQEVGTQVRTEYSKQAEYQDSFVYVYGWTGRSFCLSHCLGTQNITITP